MEKGERLGLEKGEKLGREADKADGKREVAAKLKATGMVCANMAARTGLSREEIEQL